MNGSCLNRRALLWLALCLIICGAACSDMPRDPKETLRRVQAARRVRVGLVESGPWVVRTGGEPAGVEVELVRRFAAGLGATPEWHWGGEQQHMEALEHYELDVVIGGLTKKTPWSDHVGLTGPYFEDRMMVGVPRSMSPPKELKGVQVATRGGESIAAYLEKKGAVPVRVEDLKQASGPVAGPDWELEQLGLALTDTELHSEEHVMATPAGENGWLKRLDDFLQAQRPQVKNLLQQEVAGR